MNKRAWPGRSRMIPALNVRPGDIVSTAGLRGRRSAIIHVGYVDRGELVTIYGRQPWGQRWRDVTKQHTPAQLVELLVEPDDPHGGTR